MSTWIPPTSAEQPDITLTDWRLFEVLAPEIGHPTFHIAGYLWHERAGRVSSPIEELDAASRCGVSRAGRVYRLSGYPGFNGDAEYTWARWLRKWNATVLRDYSLEAVKEFAAAAAARDSEGEAHAPNSSL